MIYPPPYPHILPAAILASQIAGTLRATLPGQDKDWYDVYVYNYKCIKEKKWIPISSHYPPENVLVLTRCNYQNKITNEGIRQWNGSLFVDENDIREPFISLNEWKYIED